MGFLAFITRFIPLKWLLVGLSVLLVIGAGLYSFHRYRDGIAKQAKAEIIHQVQVEALKNNLSEAWAAKVFAEQQAAKAAEANIELTKALAASNAKIASSSKVIHERVATGELPNPKTSALITSTVDQIEALEAARTAK